MGRREVADTCGAQMGISEMILIHWYTSHHLISISGYFETSRLNYDTNSVGYMADLGSVYLPNHTDLRHPDNRST